MLYKQTRNGHIYLFRPLLTYKGFQSCASVCSIIYTWSCKRLQLVMWNVDLPMLIGSCTCFQDSRRRTPFDSTVFPDFSSDVSVVASIDRVFVAWCRHAATAVKAVQAPAGPAKRGQAISSDQDKAIGPKRRGVLPALPLHAKGPVFCEDRAP